MTSPSPMNWKEGIEAVLGLWSILAVCYLNATICAMLELSETKIAILTLIIATAGIFILRSVIVK